MSTLEFVGLVVAIVVALAALVIALVATAWNRGHVSSYDGWIRRVETERKAGDDALEKRIDEVEQIVAELPAKIGAQVKGQLDAFQRELPEKVAIVVARKLSDALVSAKSNQLLVDIGNAMKGGGA